METAFSVGGINVLQRYTDGPTIYSYNAYPGGEFMIYWHNDLVDLDVLVRMLQAEGIDTDRIIETIQGSTSPNS